MGYIYKNDAHVKAHEKHNEKVFDDSLHNKHVKEYKEQFSKKSLEHLRMKHVYLTEKRQKELIGSLTLEDKIFYGIILNDEEETIQILKNSDIEELDGELTFGSKSYEDGIEIHTNNKY
jgi:hypothetical protein